LGCFIKIFDEKFMPVIIELFIGRWSRVVNVKNRERRTEARRQMADDRGQMADKDWQRVLNAEGGMIKRRAKSIVHSVDR